MRGVWYADPRLNQPDPDAADDLFEDTRDPDPFYAEPRGRVVHGPWDDTQFHLPERP